MPLELTATVSMWLELYTFIAVGCPPEHYPEPAEHYQAVIANLLLDLVTTRNRAWDALTELRHCTRPLDEQLGQLLDKVECMHSEHDILVT